nr:MAG TPA: hypothetical protein [Caudoviricetes sp.]
MIIRLFVFLKVGLKDTLKIIEKENRYVREKSI